MLKVGLLSGNEAWIVDTAGCQYGFRDALVPFEKYLTDKSCRIMNKPTPYNAKETTDLDFFSTLPFMNQTQAQREDRKMERQARLHFAVFVDEHISKDVLDGSATEFTSKLEKFNLDLKIHMMDLGKDVLDMEHLVLQ